MPSKVAHKKHKKIKSSSGRKKALSANRRSKLQEFQSQLSSAFMNPLDPKMRSLPRLLKNGKSMAIIAEKYMKPNDRLTSLERLEIYNRQYWFRLINALHDDFPGLRSILGDKVFSKLIVAYLNRYPSKSFTIRDLGSRLPQFIKEKPSIAGKRAAVALEIARFEWAQIEAYDGDGRPLIDPSLLVRSKPEKIKLALQPYITFLDLNYALDDFIVALRKEHAQRSEAGSEKTRSGKMKPCKLPKRKKVYLAVHRYQHDLYFKVLDKAAFVLLTELKKGVSLGKACERAFANLPKNQQKEEVAMRLIHQWFNVWNGLGWFCIN